ncbi:putative 3-hydroxybutyryl-CoA dehydrogenase [Paenibacillus sp. P1XP2]|nr:putative 3-hydroxybutyryl-CoA dehydrogenase [Paenibacillus sp. P1XP2]
MNYKNITVAGSGVLGSQIAYQTAFKGFQVTVYDINDEALERAKERISQLKPHYQADLGATQEEVEAAYGRMSFSSDLPQAVADADLVIEAIPEVVSIKTDFYASLGKAAPEKTIFATNSSTCCQANLLKLRAVRRNFWRCISPTRFGKTIRRKS